MIDADTIDNARARIAAAAGVPMGFLFGAAHPTCRGTIDPVDSFFRSPVMQIQTELGRRAKKAQRVFDFLVRHGHAPPRQLRRRQRHRVGTAKR